MTKDIFEYILIEWRMEDQQACDDLELPWKLFHTIAEQ